MPGKWRGSGFTWCCGIDIYKVDSRFKILQIYIVRKTAFFGLQIFGTPSWLAGSVGDGDGDFFVLINIKKHLNIVSCRIWKQINIGIVGSIHCGLWPRLRGVPK